MDNLYHVQYADTVNASVKSYSHLGEEELLVTSVFPTLQGEGPMAGRRCTFIRLSGCNRGKKVGMACQFCDTRFLLSEGKVLTINQLVTQVKSHQRELVVITGGEPALQPNLVPLIKSLMDEGKEVQIESNGDRLARGWNKLIDDHREYWPTLVVSPKAVEKLRGYRPLKEDVEAALSCLKFIIDARPGSLYSQLPGWAFDFPKDMIWLSPLAVYKRRVETGEIANFWDDNLLDKEATSKNYAHAAWLCEQTGFRLTIQQHLLVNIE
jgi:organic radical activating enzyme